MSHLSLDVKRLVMQAYAVVKSSGCQNPQLYRKDIADTWRLATPAHFARLAASCNPPVTPTPELILAFLSYLSPPKAKAEEAA